MQSSFTIGRSSTARRADGWSCRPYLVVSAGLGFGVDVRQFGQRAALHRNRNAARVERLDGDVLRTAPSSHSHIVIGRQNWEDWGFREDFRATFDNKKGSSIKVWEMIQQKISEKVLKMGFREGFRGFREGLREGCRKQVLEKFSEKILERVFNKS